MSPWNAVRRQRPANMAFTYITLFADASYCHKTKAYGWCFWLKFPHLPDGQLCNADPLELRVRPKTVIKSGGGIGLPNPASAELEALRQGVEYVMNSLQDIPGGLKTKKLVAQSDCMEALDKIEPTLKQYKRDLLDAYTKHVKGHQGNASPRSSVNTTCDRKAGEEMRKYRDGVNNVQR